VSTNTHTNVIKYIDSDYPQNTIVVAQWGNDTFGKGDFDSPYKTIAYAFSLVSSTRNKVIVLVGSYSEAACLSWPTVSKVELICLGNVTISTATDEDQVIEIAPGVQTSTWEATIRACGGSLCIDHGNNGQDGIKIDHSDVAKKLILNLENVYDNAYDNGDKFITVTHGGSGNAVRIYAKGNPNDECEGAIYFKTEDGGDRLYLHDMFLEGGIETSADAVALDIRLRNCIILHEGVSGGNAAQQIDAAFCLSNNSGTLAALDTSDLAGSHTEALLFPTS